MDSQKQLADMKIIRLPQVMEITGLARSTIYKWIKQGDFPAQVNLGPNSVGFLSTEISEWLTNRVRHSRPKS